MKAFLAKYKRLNWKLLALLTITLVYIGMIVIMVSDDKSPIHYGGDYLAFWSAGKIADEISYSEIYDLEKLKIVQVSELKLLGFLESGSENKFAPLPAPYFSFFVVPFQLLSRISVSAGYWLWNLLNLCVLLGYLNFFCRRVLLSSNTQFSTVTYLVLVIASFPVFDNFLNGQVNILMLVCLGEYVRNATLKKPLISGIWLAGLLLKPQLLIIIIPIILFTRSWKTFFWFSIASTTIIGTSFILSGVTGNISLIKLWLGYGIVIPSAAPEAMINWRMIGVYLNSLLASNYFGWIIAGIGSVITILAVLPIMRRFPISASSECVITITGVFSATLAVTWHSHHHMALVLIPLLIYLSAYTLLSEKILFLWVIIAPVIYIGSLFITTFISISPSVEMKIGELLAISGFLSNLLILFSLFHKYRYSRLKEPSFSPTQKNTKSFGDH